MSQVQEEIDFLLKHNQQIKAELYKPAQGILRHPYLSAGTGDSYPDLTDWDTIWSGIAYMKMGDHAPLLNSMLNLIEHIQPDGKGQRRIGFKKYSAPPYQIRPFLACGAYALSKQIGTDWLHPGDLDKLHANLLYWHTHRTGREGLLKWLHVDEGFADNGLCNWCWEGDAIQAVDLNAQLTREHLALSRVFSMAGDQTRSTQHQNYAEQLTQRINASLWCEEDQCYYSLYNPGPRHEASSLVKVKGYNNLWPLWLGITTKERAIPLIEKYLLNSEEFLSPYGIRSMSKSETFYNNMTHGMTSPMTSAPIHGPVMYSWCSNWQGPTWPVCTWLGIKALMRYGYATEAKAIATSYLSHLVKCLKKDGQHHENHHAETGVPLKAKGIGSWFLMLPYLLDDDEDDYFPGL